MQASEVARRIIADDPHALTVEPDHPHLAAPIDRQELAWCIPVGRGKVWRAVRIAQGGCSSVHVPLAPLLSVPLIAQVDRFVLVHSHPAGSLTISEPDKQLTRHVLRAAALVGLTMEDHVIITPQGTHVSLVDSGALAPITHAAAPQAAS